MKNTWTLVEHRAVKVTDKYYDEALHIDVKNMLTLDADRLLAGFRETAAIIAGMDDEAKKKLMKGKERYGGGWENSLIGGHTLGHYITALAQAVGNPGLTEAEKKDVDARLDYILDALMECQKLTEGSQYEGYIFGSDFPTKEFSDNVLLQFDNVEKGLSDLFTQAWVPWYTMHKILTGLNAAFIIARKETALKLANNLGHWIAKRTEGWSEETNKTVLSIEYGGMNDCLYELFVINRELKEKGSALAIEDLKRIFDAAHRFDETELFEKILSGKENVLDNTHANTTIPKFIGALARYEADTSQAKYLEYAESFFDMVVSKHTYVTGGNSENEHFGKDYVLDAERTHVNNETCNTYNMLKFARRLFAVTGKKKYLDYSERTLINAIMASQNHETGFTTYFQPMATGYHKVFNTLDGNFWCCTGTGYENFTKLQRGIYYRAAGKMLVSIYLASELTTDDYKLIQECGLTKSEQVKIIITPNQGKNIEDDLWLRIPEWVADMPRITLNGKDVDAGVHQEEKDFIVISKEILSSGGELVLELPMGLHYENLPDGKTTYAFLYGPYLLSARLGTAKMKTKSHGVQVSVPAERAVESDEIKLTDAGSVDDFLSNIERYLVKRQDEMEFDLKGTDHNLVFTTHYNQYRECYGIYWKF
ncbi:beta-L-arabinofuranosidase domain-containing protein [Butyrivibrio sp. INlla16]|uniref:beta-L-arabinofuranosidase domain-containing protein n=1 Tax=Butyrivibrio sp. INlla16 TaxID=1520807 RepID=UPI00087F38CB|nr:beta-L-arabinofuranosidase domain-containing protein [Butyrivibrio sp. INlla16]SDB67565.1 hypothetical protein SAMN02910263_03978 [Butyrivibrio sp. INlla16]